MRSADSVSAVTDRQERDEPAGSVLDIRAPRRRQVLAVVTAAVFILAGAVLATGPVLPAVVGVASIVFFTPVAIYQLVMLMRGRPRVLLDDRGLTDHASPAGSGLLPWSRIRGARVEIPDGRTRLVVVDVVDPEELVARAGRWSRRSRKMAQEQFGSPVVLPVRGLGIRSDVLCRAIAERAVGA